MPIPPLLLCLLASAETPQTSKQPLDSIEKAYQVRADAAKSILNAAIKDLDDRRKEYEGALQKPDNAAGIKALREAFDKASRLLLEATADHCRKQADLLAYQLKLRMQDEKKALAKVKSAETVFTAAQSDLARTEEALKEAEKKKSPEDIKAKTEAVTKAKKSLEEKTKDHKDSLDAHKQAESEVTLAKNAHEQAAAEAARAEGELLKNTNPELVAVQGRLDALEASQARIDKGAYDRPDAVASDARYLYELVTSAYPKWPKEIQASISEQINKAPIPVEDGLSARTLSGGGISRQDKVFLSDHAKDKHRQPVLLVNEVIEILGIADNPRIKGKPLQDQIEAIFGMLHYPTWRNERIRFSVLLNHVNVPHQGTGSPMVAASGVFRAYFTPHRFIPGGQGAWNHLMRRFSVFAGIGTPLSSDDSKQLADARIISVGLGYDLNHHFTVMLGVANFRLKTGEASSDRVNSLTLGVAINSEFFKPLLGLKD